MNRRIPTLSSLISLASLVLLVAAIAAGCGCAATAPPADAAVSVPPDEATLLVASLTEWLKLDPVQQDRLLQSARAWVERNMAIRASWERGQKMRPQALLESRSVFERDLLAILTPPQTEKIRQASILLATGGRRVR